MNEKNSTPKIHLREFTYFDRQKIEDFLSGIEDGLIRESMETQRKHGKEVKGEAGIKGILSVGGTTGYDENELQRLCRVKKILKKNEKFELFSLIPGFKMDRERIKDFIKSFRNMPKMLGKPPKVGDLQVGYPAMVVTPIAIYR